MAEGEIYDIDYQQPCEDAISREAVIRLVEQYPNIIGNRCSGLIADIKHLPSVTPSYNSVKTELEQTRWIPVTSRPMTEEEMQEYECDYGFIYNCSLPDDGQDTLIQTPFGIRFATFYNDTQYGIYWEGFEDEDDVIAWMPLPKPYKEDKK